MNNKIQAALTAARSTMGIDIENGTEVSLEEATKLGKFLKEEYGINTVVVNKGQEKLKASMEEYIIEKKPALEFCGTPPDGKQRRRERRALERKSKKNKIFK